MDRRGFIVSDELVHLILVSALVLLGLVVVGAVAYFLLNGEFLW